MSDIPEGPSGYSDDSTASEGSSDDNVSERKGVFPSKATATAAAALQASFPSTPGKINVDMYEQTPRGVPFRGDRHGGRGVTGTGILSEGSSGINAASADQSSITTPSEGSQPIGSLIPSTPGPSTSSVDCTSDSSLSEFATPMAATPMKTRRAFHNDSVGKALTKPPLAQRLVDQVPHFCLVQDRHWKFCPDATVPCDLEVIVRHHHDNGVDNYTAVVVECGEKHCNVKYRLDDGSMSEVMSCPTEHIKPYFGHLGVRPIATIGLRTPDGSRARG